MSFESLLIRDLPQRSAEQIAPARVGSPLGR